MMVHMDPLSKLRKYHLRLKMIKGCEGDLLSMMKVIIIVPALEECTHEYW